MSQQNRQLLGKNCHALVVLDMALSRLFKSVAIYRVAPCFNHRITAPTTGNFS
jgi:hypothetical protein